MFLQVLVLFIDRVSFWNRTRDKPYGTLKSSDWRRKVPLESGDRLRHSRALLYHE